MSSTPTRFASLCRQHFANITSSTSHSFARITVALSFRVNTPMTFHHLPFHYPDSSSSPSNSIPEFEVESILKLRLLRSHPHYRSNLTTHQQLAITTNPHHYEFLVKWLGYRNHDNTWEPYDNLVNAPQRTNEFIQQHHLPQHWQLNPQPDANTPNNSPPPSTP